MVLHLILLELVATPNVIAISDDSGTSATVHVTTQTEKKSELIISQMKNTIPVI